MKKVFSLGVFLLLTVTVLTACEPTVSPLPINPTTTTSSTTSSSTTSTSTSTTSSTTSSSTTSTTTTSVPATNVYIAIGDSNASGNNNPARGLPWSERLGVTVRNGSNDSHGAGYVVKGTYTNRSFAEELLYENSAVPGSTKAIVQGGINDLQSKTVAEIEAGMNLLKSNADSIGFAVYFVKIIPSRADSYVQPYEAKRNQINSDMVSLFPGKVIDCNSVLDLNNDSKLDPAFALDPIHLNSAGEQALASCIATNLGL